MANFSQFGNDLFTGVRSFDIVGKRRIWFSIAALLVLVSIVVPSIKGFEFGIEFRGGSEFTVSEVGTNPDQATATDAVVGVVPEAVARVSVVGNTGVRIQTEQLSDAESTAISSALATAYDVPATQVTSSFIGPSWGADVTGQSIRALLVFIVLAGLIMALYFRTWKMSAAAMIALFHDLVITAGVYAILGFEVTPAAVIGFLTILGYSLYDTVVVFDKIRETTREDSALSSRTFAQSVNLAVNQTLVRSINTSVVALLPVGSILFIGAAVLGAGTLRDISLALFVGILAGTYSTIFIAAPVYSLLRENEPEIKKHSGRVTALAAASASPAPANS